MARAAAPPNGCREPASAENVAHARRFVRHLEADMGGTEIAAALRAAYRITGEPGIAGEPGMDRDLLLITDGEVWDTKQPVAEARRSGYRIFTVGVGNAVAEAFVRKLAAATGGACEFVAPREDMAARIHRHFQRILAPPARAGAGGEDAGAVAVIFLYLLCRSSAGKALDAPQRRSILAAYRKLAPETESVSAVRRTWRKWGHRSAPRSRRAPRAIVRGVGSLDRCRALAFDLFGTVLDLGGSLTPALDTFLRGRGGLDAAAFWRQLRYRQRLEQYQDSLMMLGHGGYLETVRRAFSYVARANGLPPTAAETAAYLAAWQELAPFPECHANLERLRGRFELAALSNGDAAFLQHLAANRIRFDFDHVISVDTVAAFKPHPAVYRAAARLLRREVGELIMVSANSFDVLGARTCGLRGIYVNRYRLPYEETEPQFLPDAEVADFDELTDLLLGKQAKRRQPGDAAGRPPAETPRA